jgi:hypothetical protein
MMYWKDYGREALFQNIPGQTGEKHRTSARIAN